MLASHSRCCTSIDKILPEPEWALVNGQPVDFIGAFALMDNRLRAQLQTELAPCSTQVFMDAYAQAYDRRCAAGCLLIDKTGRRSHRRR
jgi:hypothetical protein